MNETDTQPKWYILHTYSGYEQMVKDNLEKLIENNNLSDQITDLKIPLEETIVEDKNGKKKTVYHKLLPCYVFIKMIYSNQLWYLVTNTRGVTGFCGPQGRPIPMKDEEIRKMRLEDFVANANFKVGDEIYIEFGPLSGFTGRIIECHNDTQKAKVETVMFDRAQIVDVEYNQIKLLDENKPE